jgi:DNA-binding transcriptional MerR regulator
MCDINVKVKPRRSVMRIGELSRRCGASARMIRYYEQQGLLTARRSSNAYRDYDVSAVTTVTQIRALLAAGLSTDVIRIILPCARGDAPVLDPCPEVLAALTNQLSELDNRIDCLRHSRQALHRYITATVPDGEAPAVSLARPTSRVSSRTQPPR